MAPIQCRFAHGHAHAKSFTAGRREIIYCKWAINPISLVFQNIGPPSPSPPGECVPPAFVGGEGTLARGRGGWGVNILEDERDTVV
jgi:hypothetical protein